MPNKQDSLDNEEFLISCIYAARKKNLNEDREVGEVCMYGVASVSRID